jgi:hypothetical protein
MSALADVHRSRFRTGDLREIRPIRTPSRTAFAAREYRHRSSPLITPPELQYTYDDLRNPAIYFNRPENGLKMSVRFCANRMPRNLRGAPRQRSRIPI